MPHTSIVPGAEPFYFPGKRAGCLLIHGFTGTPNEMRWLGTQLSLAGHTVMGVRLAGHGTNPEDMNTTRWRDWHASVEEDYRRLRAECERVFVIGLSLGGVLALHLAAQEKPDGIVAMAAPVHIHDWRLTVLRPFQRFIPYWRKAAGNLPGGAAASPFGVVAESSGLSAAGQEGITTRTTAPASGSTPDKTAGQDEPVGTAQLPPDKAMHRPSMDYDRMPTACILSMLDFFRIVEKELPCIHVPTRLIYARRDRLAPRAEVQFIYDRISSMDKRMLSLDRSGHIVCDDVERETVLEAVLEFMDEIFRRSAPHVAAHTNAAG